MKTAISISDGDPDKIAQHFVRCKTFLVVDKRTDFIKKVTNPFFNDTEDAGRKAVNYLKAMGVCRIVSGDFGGHVQDEADKNTIQLIIVDTSQISVNNFK